MKVHCPIPGCNWSRPLTVLNQTEEQIYGEAKSLISNHKRTSKGCFQFMCSCGDRFTKQFSLNRHMTSKSLSTVRGSAQQPHCQLSYVSIITRDNHKILNVDTLDDTDEPIRNFAAFGNPNEIVYGSNIGRNKTTINVPSHATSEFVRAGTKVRQIATTRPSKRPKQFGSDDIDDSPLPFDDELDDTMCTFISEPADVTLTSSSSKRNKTTSSSRTTRSTTQKAKNIGLLSSFTDEETNDRRSYTGRNDVEIPNAITMDAPDDDINEETHACRRSTRLINRQMNNEEVTSKSSSTGSSVARPADDQQSQISSNQETQSSSISLTDDQFFTIHDERSDNDQPELNINGVNGNMLDDEDSIDIGWGGDDSYDDEDPDDLDLDFDPFAARPDIIPELERILQNLSLKDEVYGNSSALPPYNNNELPIRTEEEMALVNTKVRSYVRQIKRHRRNVSLTPLEHMKYLEILVEMNRSNAPASLFDKIGKLIFTNFGPSDEDSAPTKEKLMTWIEKKVHPPELIHLSKPKKTVLSDCPSGRSVAITHFDYEYQLALLLSNEEIMNPENLLFPNKDDPFELTPEDGPLEDVNSGFFHHKMTRAICKYRNDLLFPFVDFCDGTNVSRNSLEPYLRCLGIFNRKTRNKPESWFALGFFEPLVNFSPLDPNQKYETTDKLNDYHHVLKFLMQDCVRLEQSGFIFDLDLGENRKFEVVFRPVTQLVLGDCKGADILCGRFGSHRKTVGICRDCDCPSTEASSSVWQCNFFDKVSMRNKTAEELRGLSFWKLTSNAFDFVNTHIPDVWGVFGITPPEILHLFYIGLCVYLCQGFIFQRSTAMRKYLDASAISLYTNNKRQSLRGMPHLAAYRNGFVTDVAMTTGKEKFSKVFLLYLFLMKTDITRNLVRQKPKKNEPKVTRRHIKEWIYLLESSLCLSSFLKSDSIDRNDLLQRIRDIEDEVTVLEDSFFQRQIRRYMKLFKTLVKREKGQGLDLVKFHQLLHIFKYILHHGSPANTDGSRPEAVGKFLIKNPGRRTQIRLSLLTLQTAKKMVEQRNIQDFAKIVLRRDKRNFNSKKLHNFFMFPKEIDSDSDEDDESRDEDSDSDEEVICHNNRDHQQQDRRRKRYQLSGSVYELYMHQSHTNLEMKIDWKTKVKYTNLWSKEFLLGMERRLFTDIAQAGGTIKLSKSIIGRTSLKVFNPGNDTVRYYAHPSFRSGLPWYDWVMLDWGRHGILPGRLLMILETTSLTDDDFLYSQIGEDEDDNQVVLNQSSLLKSNRIFLVVRSAERTAEPADPLNFKFASRLSKHIRLEDTFSIVSVNCLVGPAYVIANVPYGDAEADTEAIRDFILVKDYREWSEYFINRNNTERYGQYESSEESGEESGSE